MKDKIVAITGANSGLGLETARQLAARGAQIILVCRDPVRGATAQRVVAGVSTARSAITSRSSLYIGQWPFWSLLLWHWVC
jgi:NAD(P)-dependent dehydrogenase (short-subunit alcohol dehydrogenase family)